MDQVLLYVFISCKYKYPDSLGNTSYGKPLQYCAVQVRRANVDLFLFLFFVLQLATWDSVHGLNGSLKESRIENGMQGVTVKVVTLLVMLTFIIVTFKKYLCFVGVDIIVLIRAQNLQPSNSAEFNRIGTFLIHKVLNTPKLFHVCLHILLANIIITLFETVTAC